MSVLNDDRTYHAIRSLLDNVRATKKHYDFVIEERADELRPIGREMALAKTKLDEAFLWLEEALRQYNSLTIYFKAHVEEKDDA